MGARARKQLFCSRFLSEWSCIGWSGLQIPKKLDKLCCFVENAIVLTTSFYKIFFNRLQTK